MRWLWFVSVGATDVRFPAWSQDAAGAWTVLHQVEVSKHDRLRTLHDALLWLATIPDGLRLSADQPPVAQGPRSASVHVERIDIDGSPVYTIGLDLPGAQTGAAACRISQSGHEIPNDHERSLTLFFPKVAELLPVVRATRGRDELTVVVLNTRRDAGPQAAKEPVAAGPLVARFIAEHLELTLLSGGSAMPNALPGNACTWLDILQGRETLEDRVIETALPQRLDAAMSAFSPRPGDRVVVSTSGGLPGLKPVIERIPAIRFGGPAVSVLDSPEHRTTAPPTLKPLAEKWADRETLRFHCAEALREGDLAAAYGLARRRANAAWAQAVLRGVGPLIELPALNNRSAAIEGLQPYELRAARVEAALLMQDVPQAIRQLHALLECVHWTLLRRSTALCAMGMNVAQDQETLCGAQAAPAELADLLLPSARRSGEFGLSSQAVMGAKLLNRLANREPPALRQAIGAYEAMASAYWRRSGQKDMNGDPVKDSLHDVRNALSHGAGAGADLEAARRGLLASGLAQEIGKSPGTNFLAGPLAQRLLSSLRPAGAVAYQSEFARALAGTLTAVIRGEA